MRLLRDASIARKLNVLTVVAVSTALTLCCGSFLWNDVSTLRRAKIQQIDALAKVLGENTISALEFDDQETAISNLASLSKQPGVEVALLFDSHGELFATYPDGLRPSEFGEDKGFVEVEYVIAPRANGESGLMLDELFADEGLEDQSDEVAETDGESGDDQTALGRIIIRANTQDISSQIAKRFTVALFVLIGSLLIGVVISLYVRRSITAPVDDLVTAAGYIAREGDYSHRVSKHGDDELGVLSDAFNRMLSELQAGREKLQEANDELEVRVRNRTEELASANAELHREMSERETLQEELITASRHAGMAEIATGVLHNVGNVLNSVNVSAHIIIEKLENSRVGSVGRATALIAEHNDDLGTFFTVDERGRRLPGFLENLSSHLKQDVQSQLEEMQSLIGNIEHVKEIVSTQQSYARVRGAVEALDVLTLVQDALQINDSAMIRDGIRIERDFNDVPRVVVEKHKILQILVNLIGNARHALQASENPDKTMTLSVACEGDHVSVQVRDNGVGIAPENLERIFTHGFTTKKEGHGFGLHSSALAAQELGGSLSVHSDGHGHGAVFTLRLPTEAQPAAA